MAPSNPTTIDEKSSSTETPQTAAPETTEEVATSSTGRQTTTTEAPDIVTAAPSDASPYVTAFGGAEQISLPPGEEGSVSVIIAGPYESGSQILPVVVRNLTDETLTNISLTGVARDATGGLVGSGEDQGLDPAIVAPGEIAWGYVYFGSDMPQGTTFDITADGEPLGEQIFGALPLEITELNVSQDTIVGIASNTGGVTITGPIGVSILCLSPDGAQLTVKNDYATADEVSPGASTAFTVNFYGDPPCASFLVASSGYSF